MRSRVYCSCTALDAFAAPNPFKLTWDCNLPAGCNIGMDPPSTFCTHLELLLVSECFAFTTRNVNIYRVIGALRGSRARMIDSFVQHANSLIDWRIKRI